MNIFPVKTVSKKENIYHERETNQSHLNNAPSSLSLMKTMNATKRIHSRSAFTLIELLVVIAIIAVLAVAVIITMNPSELMKQARDSNRLSDLENIRTATQLYFNDVSPTPPGATSTSYLSLLDPTVGTTGGSCSGITGTTHCAASSTYRKSDSTGWIPVDMTKISIGSPLPVLPVDPINTASSGFYYTYQTDGTYWEVSANAESQKFQAQSPQFTVGTSASLIFTCGVSTVTGTAPDTTIYKTVLGADGNCWLASNLGTANIAQSAADSSAYGWLYQWGRLTDGHQITTSTATTTLSSTDVPGNADFIEAPNSPYDWRSPQNDNLWQGTSTAINNPCPIGWSIPTQTQWSNWVSAVGLASCSSGCDTALYNTTLKLTDAGLRDPSDALFAGQGASGYYWSSSIDGTNAYNFAFHSSFVVPANYDYRAYGFSARCIKD